MYNSTNTGNSGRSFMAYKRCAGLRSNGNSIQPGQQDECEAQLASSSPNHSVPTSAKTAPLAVNGRTWEDVRKEARKLEGELEVKLAAYAKLCSGFEANYRHRTGDASSIGADQLAQSKAAELEDLLQRLSDLNDELSGLINGISDSRSHTLARHRDILQEFTQEFRRLNSTLGAARDRVQLLAGSDSPHIGLTMGGPTLGSTIRERQNIQAGNNALLEMINQAQAVGTNLTQQRSLLSGIGDKVVQVAGKFPLVNSVLKAIRLKKSKDTLVLSAVVAACILFAFFYIMMK